VEEGDPGNQTDFGAVPNKLCRCASLNYYVAIPGDEFKTVSSIEGWERDVAAVKV